MDHFSTILLLGLFSESWHGKPCVQRIISAAVIMPFLYEISKNIFGWGILCGNATHEIPNIPLDSEYFTLVKPITNWLQSFPLLFKCSLLSANVP